MTELDKFVDVSRSIDKYLHQVWLEAPGKPENYIPENLALFCDRMKSMNTDYEYVMWNNAKVAKLFDEFPEIRRWKNFYYNIIGKVHHIERCDVARWLILYCWGGCVLDCDFLAIQPLQTLLAGRSFAICTDWIHLEYLNVLRLYKKNRFQVFNGFLASAHHQSLVAQMLDHFMSGYKEGDISLVMETCGPIACGRFFELHKLDDEVMYPEIFIDTCYIIPEGFHTTKEEQERRNCSRVKPYVKTQWTDSASWQAKAAPQFVQFTVSKHHIYLLLILLIISLVLGCMYKMKKQKLTVCEMKLDTCSNSKAQ